MNMLKLTLLLNASFSFLSGLGLLIFNRSFSEWMGLDSGMALYIVGAGLVFFAGTVYLESKKLSRKGVLSIIIQDLIWVVSSLVVWIGQLLPINETGYLLIMISAVIVLDFAVFQFLGYRAQCKNTAAA